MELRPCLILIPRNNRVSYAHVNVDRQTERPCLTEEADECLNCQATQKLTPLFQEEHECVHMRVYVSVYVLWIVQRPGQAVRDYGGWVSQNPDPIQPSSAQKVLRVTADWQTEWKTDQQTHSRGSKGKTKKNYRLKRWIWWFKKPQK